MTFRSIAIVSVLGILAVAVLYFAVFPSLSTDARFWFTAISRTLMLSMVALAAGLAAHRFGWWSEYVGRAWTLFFVEYAVLTVGEIARRASPGASTLNEICVVVANIAGIGAYVLMARSLSAAGLAYYGSRVKKIAFMVLALAVALALCQAPIREAFQSLGTNDPSIGAFVSPLADVITFVLVAPLLLTTFALRGGQLFWMFAFLTTGTVGWMVNQGAGALVTLAGGGENAVRTGRMTGFAMACFLIAAAALTQWLAAQRAMRGAQHA
ncbi:MAG TPA: hypothetical protein VF266_25870 [Thermoanaerobaculia bacterium]